MVGNLYAELGKTRVVWAALCGAVVLFGVVLAIVPPFDEPSAELVPFVLLSGIALAPVAFVARRAILGPTLGLWSPPEAPGAEPLVGEALDAAVREASDRYRRGTIIGCALGEVIAMHGLMASLLSANPSWYLGMLAVAAPVMLVQMPRAAGLIGVAAPGAREAMRAAL